MGKPGPPREREDYLIESGAGRVVLLAATDVGVEHAVWDFLHRLGYRQFFPGEHGGILRAART
jgi:hypothetical protein